MERKTIREGIGGPVLGFIETQPDGKKTLRDPTGRALGHYDPKTDQTKTAQFAPVGNGDLLMTLLKRR